MNVEYDNDLSGTLLKALLIMYWENKRKHEHEDENEEKKIRIKTKKRKKKENIDKSVDCFH